MLQSLRLHCPEAHVYVLCMDAQTREILEEIDLPHVCCLSLADVEDEELLAVKPTRSVAEYCWTLSPCLPWYVLQLNPEVDAITYIDADLYFYSSLEPLFQEIGDASITIIEHRFPPSLRHLEVRGRFCVEWVGFRRDAEGMACLAHWREQCIEWCFYRLEEERMGDQKYLDRWPQDFKSVHVLKHPGAGIAPWNFGQYVFGRDAKGRQTVEGIPLIFYHFHQFQLLTNGRFNRVSGAYTGMRREPEDVYAEYETALRVALSDVLSLHPKFSAGMKPASRVYAQRLAQILLPEGIKEWLKKFIRAV